MCRKMYYADEDSLKTHANSKPKIEFLPVKRSIVIKKEKDNKELLPR